MLYWIGRMGARTVSFVLLPVYTSHIPPESWGVLSLLFVTGDLALLLVSCQMSSALYRFWARSESETRKRRLAGLALATSLTISSLVFLPLYLFAEQAGSLLGLGGYGMHIRILLLTEQLALISEVVLVELRLRDRAKRYAVVDVGQNFAIALCSIFYVAVLKLGMLGVLLGQMTAFVIIGASLLPPLLKRIEINLDRAMFRELMRFSLPLIPSALAMLAVHSIDRYFLQFMLGPAEVGLYSIGYKFGMMVNVLVFGPFLLIWEPKSYEIAKLPDAPVQYGRIFSYLLALVAFVSVGLGGVSRELVEIFTDEKYADAWTVVFPVAVSYCLFALDSVSRVGLLISGRTRVLMYVVLVTSGINVAGNWLLIPRVGRIGAAWATIASFAFLFAVNLVIGRRYQRISFEWRRIATVLFVAVLVYFLPDAAGRLLGRSPTYVLFGVKAAVVMIYPVLLLAGGFFTKDELGRASQMLRSVGRTVRGEYV